MARSTCTTAASTANVFGNYALVRDQITLVRGSLTQEKMLLRRRELATDYRLRVSGGISYRFGSIFNNVVNPRFTVPRAASSSDRF